MKKILFIYNKKRKHIPFKSGIHTEWVKDCKDVYNVEFWGKGFTNTSLQSLKNKIDSFKPNFIYTTKRNNYLISPSECWLPDLTNIKVPKIHIGVDTYKWNRNDDWYNQFDKVYCRHNLWKPVFYDREAKINENIQKNIITWYNVPVFRWSAPNVAFSKKKLKRKGLYFMGSIKRGGYKDRRIMWKKFREVKYRNKIRFRKELSPKYWDMLHTASALLCPTESNYGCFVPAKLFEFAASGATVVTNCDYVSYGIPELKGKVIDYTDLNSLEALFDMDFSKYHYKASKVMRNHTHKIRYKELFG